MMSQVQNTIHCCQY